MRSAPSGRGSSPGRRPGLVAGAVVLGLIPTLLFLVLPALNNRSAAKYFEENVYVPVTYRSLGLTAKATPAGVLLHWRTPPAHAKVFYRILRQAAFGYYDYRLPPRVAGVRCLPPAGGAADCAIEMDTLGVTRGRTFVDPNPGKGRWAYRIGVMGNWLNDVNGGDVMVVSAPTIVNVRR